MHSHRILFLLLEPGDSPMENAQFLLFLVAVIAAVDDYQDLLRLSVATAGNDHRLGANEAPPAIISVFLGDEITGILEALENGSSYDKKDRMEIKLGVDVLPRIPKDTTDRNRTSPFAFTGNKFEFRMPGSSLSISGPNIVLNTIVAEKLSLFADTLEKSSDFKNDLNKLIIDTVKKHKRIIFNGNNYSEEWVVEAEKRGLSNLKTTADVLPCFITEKSIDLFTKHNVFSEVEIHSRYEILLENYCKTLSIETLTMIDMVRKDILPSVMKYVKDLTQMALSKKELGMEIPCEPEKNLIHKLSTLSARLYENTNELENKLLEAKSYTDLQAQANYFRDVIIPVMQKVRTVADELEVLTASEYWPFPTYGELLFKV